MIGPRIHRARTAAGLSLRALAEHVGVSQTAISKFEKDQLTPSSPALLAIARACDVRVEYFFRADTVALGQPEYRKKASLGKKAQRQLEAAVEDRAERFVELVRLYPNRPIPSFRVPDQVPAKVESYDDVEEVAVQLRSAWDLGLNPLPELIDTLEDRGVLVIAIEGDDKGRFDGMAASVDGLPILVVGSRWPGDRQRFTLAHELGHLVLEGRLAAHLDEEKACNRFAGAFLAPRDAVRRELGSRRRRLEVRELYVLKHEYGLSMLGWVFRAKDLEILPEAAAGRIFKMFSRQGWRKAEPGDPVSSERPHLFEQLVFRALAEDFIGESKAAELLGVGRSEFRARRGFESRDDAAHQ